MDLFHPNLCEPEADSACHISSPTERSGLRVAAPEQYCIAVFGNVFDYVVLLVLLPEWVHAPDMLGAPIPAFPAVGLAGLQGEPAAQIEQMGNAAVARVHHFRLAVAVNFAQDCLRGIFIMHALDFGCDDFCCFVPADAFITACAAILRIAFPRWVPVNALHRVGDAVFRIDALLVAK